MTRLIAWSKSPEGTHLSPQNTPVRRKMSKSGFERKIAVFQVEAVPLLVGPDKNLKLAGGRTSSTCSCVWPAVPNPLWDRAGKSRCDGLPSRISRRYGMADLLNRSNVYYYSVTTDSTQIANGSAGAIPACLRIDIRLHPQVSLRLLYTTTDTVTLGYESSII